MVSDRRRSPAWHPVRTKRNGRPPQAQPLFVRDDSSGATGVMKHETSRALYTYWLALHRDASVRAGRISAVELAPLLPDLFLIDLAPSRDSRIRFCGATIASRYGRDLADESFLALWTRADRRMLESTLHAMTARSTGLVAGVMGETMAGGYVAYEMLLLPLVGENGGAGSIGSMVRIGGHEEHNRIRRRLVGQSLRSTRFLSAPAKGFSRAASPALDVPPPPAMMAQRRYGHLTVVNGGK